MIRLNYLSQHNLSRKCGLRNCILLSSASCIIIFCSKKLWSCSAVQQLPLIFHWPPYMYLCSQPRIKCFQVSLQQGLWFYRLVEYTFRFSVNNLSLNLQYLNIQNSLKTKAFFWLVLWFNLSQHRSPTQPLAHSLRCDGGESWKSEKTHCLRQWQLKRESKSCVHEQSKTRILVTTFHGQGGFQQSPGKPGCIMLDSYLGRQMLWHALFLLLPQLLPHTEHEVTWYGAFLGSLGVCCASCASSQLLVHPKPPCWQGAVRGRKGLGAV